MELPPMLSAEDAPAPFKQEAVKATKAPRKKRASKAAAKPEGKVANPATLLKTTPKSPAKPKATPPTATPVGNGSAFIFDGAQVRVTPAGCMVAIDILNALGQKDPSGA